MARILIIEDDLTFAQILEAFLTRNGFRTEAVPDIRSADRMLAAAKYDMLLLDYRLPDGTGMDLLQKVKPVQPSLPVIVMTSFHDIRTAVKAMRSGAYDFITKPVNPEELLMLMKEALEKKGAGKEKRKVLPATDFVSGTSPQSRKLNEYIDLVAPTGMSVLIQGESGTGKELAARTIHRKSKRATGPFVAIDCGALSPELAASELFGHVKGAFTGAMEDKTGQFEYADGGTLFLDEVGNLSYEVQVKLLRALQEREIQPIGSNKVRKIDVRLVTATNDQLSDSIRNNGFREDLYHRINEFKIRTPSLSERIEDLPLFVEHFIRQANAELGKEIAGISDKVQSVFRRYDWPGNLRELKNIVKRAVLLSEKQLIDIEALPEEMVLSIQQAAAPANSGYDLKASQEIKERELIVKTLMETRFNKSKAAKLLNIDRKTLYYKISKYGIEG